MQAWLGLGEAERLWPCVGKHAAQFGKTGDASLAARGRVVPLMQPGEGGGRKCSPSSGVLNTF